jgi:hypothetical protein
MPDALAPVPPVRLGRPATLVLTLLLTAAAACRSTPPPPPAPMTDAPIAALDAKIRRFAPVDIGADVNALPPNERAALAQLVRAAEMMNGLYLEQVWAGNVSLLATLAADRTPLGQKQLHYFVLNKGPWSRLDHNAVFLEGRAPDKPPQANFYPADVTRAELQTWLDSLGEDARAQATGFFSVIRRGSDGRLMAIPYHVQYRNTLALAARHLQEAAALTTQPTLKRYLDLRAAALLSDDYYASDIAWMELDATIEPTIGPYETYEDEWFSYKAAYEAFITLRDDAETRKLGAFGAELQGLENALPIAATYRNPALGTLAPFAS